MANVKKVDCALLAPCANTLHQKLRRAHLVSIIWGNADSPQPGDGLDPLDYGWKEKNGCYVPIWFSGPTLPDHLFEEGEQEEDNTTPVDPGNNELDIEYADADDSVSEPPWSDDSDSETDIL